MPGDFNYIRNHQLFEQVLARQTRLAEMDPKAAFASATPGILGNLSESMGGWRGREELRMEVPGVAADALSVDFHERAELGTTDMFHIVAEPGLLLAGRTQMVSPDDFRYGMSQAQAAERASRPLTDFNQKISKSLLDVMTAGGSTGGALTENFAWSATDQHGNTVSQPLATQNANQVAAVIANSTQSVAWPLRNGSVTATGHDHVASAAGAWTEAIADTLRDSVLEHPGAGNVVALVGSTVGAAVRAAIKSEYGAIESRVPFVLEGLTRSDGFGGAEGLGRIGSVDYVYAPDMDDNQALYYAGNRKPFYHSIGQADQASVGGGDGLGGWSESGDAERAGIKYGYRNYAAMGCKEPVMCLVADHVA